MKNLFALVFLLTSFAGCKKAIENIQEDMVIKAMTDGQWRVSRFTRDGNEVTASFSPYMFQFKANETVDAINNGTKESTGSWKGNAEQRTIVSAFNNSNQTLQLLNGTWQITRNSWTYVEATQTVNSEVRTLRLDK